jgi:pyruvate/2-oxoglutarate dehydrogenase complex dihydrolipoamide dehydrogenase (E3) component
MSETKRPTKTHIASDGDADVDVVVLGVGTCGEDLSLRLLVAGLDVVGIEAALVGGECAYWACLPSKLMIRAGNVLQEARRVDGMAGHAEVTPDWDLLAARVRAEVTGGWDDSYAVRRFERTGGRLVHGRGALTGPRTVTVGDESFTARRGVVIATGSKPAIPPIPGLAEEFSETKKPPLNLGGFAFAVLLGASESPGEQDLVPSLWKGGIQSLAWGANAP